MLIFEVDFLRRLVEFSRVGGQRLFGLILTFDFKNGKSLTTLIISQNVSRSASSVFLKVFCLTLFPDRRPPRTFTSFKSFY